MDLEILRHLQRTRYNGVSLSKVFDLRLKEDLLFISPCFRRIRLGSLLLLAMIVSCYETLLLCYLGWVGRIEWSVIILAMVVLCSKTLLLCYMGWVGRTEWSVIIQALKTAYFHINWGILRLGLLSEDRWWFRRCFESWESTSLLGFSRWIAIPDDDDDVFEETCRYYWWNIIN